VAGIVAYANSFQGDFVFDDRPSILESLRIRSLGSPGRLLLGSTRPLVELTLALNYAIGRLDPWGYHLVNLLIHLAAALLLYGLCRRTLLLQAERTHGVAPRHPSPPGASAASLAFAVALLWLLHPLQTQSVTYISQRAEAIMGCWALLTLYATCRAATQSGNGQVWRVLPLRDPIRPRRAALSASSAAGGWGPRSASPAKPDLYPESSPRRWTLLAVTACALGMLSKPVMVTVPLLALAYDRTFMSGSVRDALRRRRSLYLGLAATWVVLAMVVATMTPEEEATVGFKVRDFTLWEYAATQPGVVWHYFRLALWPHPLTLDYHWPVARTWPAILVPALGLGALLVVTLRAFARRSPAGFLGLWIAGILAPTSSVFPIADLVFEHRMYLALAGLLGLAVVWGWALLQRAVSAPSSRRALAATLVCAVAATYTALTIRRNEDYRSELSIWQDTVAKQPRSTRARLTYGYALAQRKRYDEATAQFNELLRLKPNDAEALNNLGLTMKEMGRPEEAIRYFRAALRGEPEDALVYNNIGIVHMEQQQREEAIANFSAAVRLQPRFVTARHNLATQLLAKGQYQEALEHYRKAAEFNPFFPDALHGLGAALLHLGRYEEAAAQCERALRLAPDNPQILANLGVARYHQGRLREAVDHLSRALALDPASQEASANLALILTEHPELRAP
jgi:Flp pilus assembly protein TadD